MLSTIIGVRPTERRVTTSVDNRCIGCATIVLSMRHHIISHLILAQLVYIPFDVRAHKIIMDNLNLTIMFDGLPSLFMTTFCALSVAHAFSHIAASDWP